jgi:hypothetical protein
MFKSILTRLDRAFWAFVCDCIFFKSDRVFSDPEVKKEFNHWRKHYCSEKGVCLGQKDGKDVWLVP